MICILQNCCKSLLQNKNSEALTLLYVLSFFSSIRFFGFFFQHIKLFQFFQNLSLHILCTGRYKIGHHFPKFIKFSCFLILHQCDYCVMEFKLIESKEPFCGICFLNAGNKKTVCLDENHFNQNKLFFIFTLILFYENNRFHEICR